MFAISDIQPGNHKLSLSYRVKNKDIAETTYSFTVAKRSKEQITLRNLINQIGM